MKSLVCLIVTLGLLSGALRAAEPRVVPLWPEGVPGLKADAADEKIVNNRIVGVHYPSLTVFTPAPEKSSGAAVIYCPGGGYVRLAPGEAEKQFMLDHGITVFVLKYRMVEYGQPAPLQDVLRAIRIIRSRAAEFGVKPDRIGVLGQSAGGHVAACAATLWDDAEGKTGNELDKIDARPNFAALIYPVITMADPYVHKGSREALLGKTPSPELIARYSLEQHVRRDMPPVLLVATMADQSVPVQNSLNFYAALVAAKVPADLQVYAQGSHGNSLDPQYGPTADWMQRMADWMAFHGWIAAK